MRTNLLLTLNLLFWSASMMQAQSSSYPLGWTDLPDTSLQAVCPADGLLPEVSGGDPYPFSMHCKNVVGAWNGGIADTTQNRLIIWGGGHSDYAGNEIYALNLETTPVTMTRLTDPSGPAVYNAPAVCSAQTSSSYPYTTTANYANWAMPDGKPNSRHDSASLVYMPAFNKMFMFNGAVACAAGAHYEDTWTLDLAQISNSGTGGWQQMDPTNGIRLFDGKRRGNLWWSVNDWDPNTNTVIVHAQDRLYSYNPATNTYNLLRDKVHFPVAANAVVDPKRNLYVEFGMEWAFNHNYAYYVKTVSLVSPYTVTDITSQITGCMAPPASTDPSSWEPWFYPGLAYDSAIDRIVIWPNSGSTVYLFDPDTNSCSTQTFSSKPPNVYNLSRGNGAIGRFRYFPSLDLFALVADPMKDAYVLKLDNGSLNTISASAQQ